MTKKVKEKTNKSFLRKANFQKRKAIRKKVNKKIGILGGIAFIISAVIGVGIFFKNGQILDYNLGNFTLSIIAWIFASCSVMALGLALLVIAAKSNSELGILQWAKDFLDPTLFEAIKCYFLFIYVPLIICGDSYYFIQALQQAFPMWKTHWYVAWIMAICAITYFGVVNTLKPRMVMVHSYLAFYIKLIPIFFFGIIAIILLGMNYDKVASSTQQLYSLAPSGFMKTDHGDINSYLYTNPMLMYGPEIGFFLSIPAMFFAYDGFYYVTSIKNQLKDPKQSPKIVVLGILCVVIIFILITISLLLSTDVHNPNRGTMLGIDYLSSNNAWIGVNSFLNICICIGCLGIISGSINFSTSLYKEIFILNDLPFARWIQKKTKWSMNRIVYFYLFGYIAIFFATLSIIGTFGFLNLSGYNFGLTRNARINLLYSFINVITNWESLFTFFTFVFIIGGSWLALKRKKIIFNKKINKYIFIIETIIAFSVISFAVGFSMIHAIGNLIYCASVSYFVNSNVTFYALANLNGTSIMLNNGITYTLVLHHNNLSWISSNGQTLLAHANIVIKKIMVNTHNDNPYLFSLIASNNNWVGASINASLITNFSLYASYINHGTNSVYTILHQDFIAQVMNFVILLFILLSCSLYSFVNAKNRKKNSWFTIKNNIFYNPELIVHY